MCVSAPYHRSRSATLSSAIDALPKQTTSVPKRPHLVVHHNYHDRSAERREINQQDWMRIKASCNSPFPIRLYNMLDRVEQDGFEHIVSWQNHGRCFVIHMPNEFTAELLPRYMQLTKLASFQRQLNLYGFNRITQGLDKGGYYHEYLLRGKGPLSLNIQRLKVKGTGVRAKANPEEEPNFWPMTWLASHSDDDVLSNTTNHRAHPQQSLHPNTVAALAEIPTNSRSCERSKCIRQHPTSPKLQPQPQHNGSVLKEWGMPFQVLDDLPETIQSLPTCEVGLTLKNDDGAYLDDILTFLEHEENEQQWNSKDLEPLPLQCANYSDKSVENVDLFLLECIGSMS